MKSILFFTATKLMLFLVAVTGSSALAHSGHSYADEDLLRYSYSGDLPGIKKALAEGANINYTDHNLSALRIASRQGSTKIVEFLLTQGAKCVAFDGFFRDSALRDAINSHHTDIVELLASKRDPSCLNDSSVNTDHMYEDNPITWATHLRDVTSVSILLKYGANPNGVEVEESPLLIAAHAGYEEIAKLLLDSGANTESRSRLGEGTPLMEAVYNNDEKMAELLLKHGAQINVLNGAAVSVLDYSILSFNSGNEPGTRLIKKLLDLGANPNLGMGSLFTVTQFKSFQENALEIAKILISRGANVNFPNNIDIRYDCGRPLHFAAGGKYSQNMVDYYISVGAEIDAITCQERESALMWAARENTIKAARVLLDRNANIGLINREGKTALDIAIEKGHKEIADLIRGKM